MRKYNSILFFITVLIICLIITMPVFAQQYSEAPELAEKVASGELPSVEERLPDEPLVIDEEYARNFGILDMQLGKYGGTIYYPAISEAEVAHMLTSNPKPLITTSEADYTPYFLKDFNIEDNGKTWIFNLRKGVKWSDGAPFTADDVMFHCQDIALNEEINPVTPSWMKLADEVVEIDKLDKYTIKFKFAIPNPAFLNQMAWYEGRHLFKSPKHYLKQFHPDYTDKEELEDIMKEEGFDHWTQLIDYKMELHSNVDLPTLAPWIPKRLPPDSPPLFVRNPYYWAVDAEGKQLPYLDEVFQEVLPQESIELRMLSGEIDYTNRASVGLLSEYRKREDRGELQLSIIFSKIHHSALTIAYNQNHQDPELKKVLQDQRFRIAVSHAINREEISELITMGIQKPRQEAPTELSPFYKPEYEKAYIEFDQEKANNLLDKIGLDERDDEGYRLLPNGERLSIIYMTFDAGNFADITQLVIDQLKEVGIDGNLRTVGWNHLINSLETADFGAVTWATWGSQSGALLMSASTFLPTSQVQNSWAPLWAQWYLTDGEKGKEPPAEIQQLLQWYDEAKSTVELDEQKKYMEKILDKAILENLYTIGTIEPNPQLTVTTSKLKNVREEYNWSAVPQMHLFFYSE